MTFIKNFPEAPDICPPSILMNVFAELYSFSADADPISLPLAKVKCSLRECGCDKLFFVLRPSAVAQGAVAG